MANGDDEPRIYQALALPEQALEKGGQEILRLGLVDDELYVTARPSFPAPSQWGEVLAEVARRLGGIYAAHDAGLSRKDVTVQIAEAFVADMGAHPAPGASKPASRRKATSAAKRRPASRPAARRAGRRPTSKRKKR